MAIQTIVKFKTSDFSIQGPPWPTIVMEFDYDDVAMVLTAFRCINQSAKQAKAEVVKDTSGAVVLSQPCPGTTSPWDPANPASQVTEVPIPTSPPGQAIPVSFLNGGGGRFTGYSLRFTFPSA